MRRVAIKWDQVTIDADGHIAGHDAGATLVRRLVRLTHNPIVIGPATRRCDGFDEMPLAFLDTDACVVINMDVLVEEGAISPEDLKLFVYVDTPQDAWDAIKVFYGL